MIKSKQILSFIFILLTFNGCIPKKIYMDKNIALKTIDLLEIRIEIKSSSMPVISIKNQNETTRFITKFNNAKINGPWKGANWDKISIIYANEIKIFNTNGIVFGKGSSGIFYNLDVEYQKYWNN